MIKNKFLAALFAVSMLLSTFAACQQDIPEVPNADDPIIEDPIIEDPVIEEPIEEEPIIEEPVEEEPVEEEPVEEDPVIEVPEELPKVEIPWDESVDFVPVEEYEHVENPEDYKTPFEDIVYLREHLPKMDGSTSLILLEMGLKAKLYGISFTEALAMVDHTTTYGSFERLINKEVDLIFSTPLSDEQFDQAEKAGMDLELVPVASEAFVFIVNADNSVDSLTQQQIKDIYSGKITNWKEVGGNDIEIVAFQRNRTSGSQNYMNQFMADTQLMSAPYELVPDAMNSLVEAIKSYDNSENAIGYSVYAYAADMYGLGDSLKFIKVDGIEPTKETMASKEYPLVNFNYAIYDKNSATEAITKTVEWISSVDGQIAIAEAGYVPYENVKREYLELTGTGQPKPQDYKEPVVKYIAGNTTIMLGDGLPAVGSLSAYTYLDFMDSSKTTLWQISGLVDKDLEAEINKKISELEAKYEAMIPEANKYIQTLTRLYDHTFNKTAHIYQEGYYFEPYKNINVTVKNGYMCILAGVFYSDGADRPFCYYAETVYYDLIKGKEIPFEELFYEGIDIDEALYKLLTDKPLGSYNQGFYLPAVTFGDITKIVSLENFAMTFDIICFNYNNPVFCVGEMFDLSLDNGYLCVEQPKSMKGIFDDTVFDKMIFDCTHSYPIYEYVNVGDDYEIRVKMLDENDEYGERNKKINDTVRQYLSETYSVDKVTEKFLADGLTMEEIENWRLRQFYYDHSFSLGGYSDAFVALTSYDAELLFDGKTGEIIEITDLLKEGWQDHIKIVKSGELSLSGYKQHTPEETADIDNNKIPANAEFIWFTDNFTYYYRTSIDSNPYLPLSFECADSGLEIVVLVDSDYVKDFAE